MTGGSSQQSVMGALTDIMNKGPVAQRRIQVYCYNSTGTLSASEHNENILSGGGRNMPTQTVALMK